LINQLVWNGSRKSSSTLASARCSGLRHATSVRGRARDERRGVCAQQVYSREETDGRRERQRTLGMALGMAPWRGMARSSHGPVTCRHPLAAARQRAKRWGRIASGVSRAYSARVREGRGHTHEGKPTLMKVRAERRCALGLSCTQASTPSLARRPLRPASIHAPGEDPLLFVQRRSHSRIRRRREQQRSAPFDALLRTRILLDEELIERT
jgi:hypothetical protein